MNNLEFQKLLFNTMISSKDSNEESTYKLKKLENGLLKIFLVNYIDIENLMRMDII